MQNILYEHTTQTKLWQRIVARISNRDEINKCKDILNEGFQVLEVRLFSFVTRLDTGSLTINQVSLTLKLHTRLPDLVIERDLSESHACSCSILL